MIRALTLVALVASLASTAAAGTYNPTLNIGDTAPTWNDLPGVDGQTHSSADLKGKQAVVVAFTCNSCPYAVDYEDRMIEFTKQHAAADSSVALVAVNVNRLEEDRLPAMKQRAEEKGFPFAYLYDESQQIAHDFGATRTPEFFVINADWKIVYMGAMDDDYTGENVSERYVEKAVQAALEGRPAEVRETPPIGCAVRFERTRRRR